MSFKTTAAETIPFNSMYLLRILYILQRTKDDLGEENNFKFDLGCNWEPVNRTNMG